MRQISPADNLMTIWFLNFVTYCQIVLKNIYCQIGY